MAEKQYGLILPSSKKNPAPTASAVAPRKNIFDDDSDDDDIPEWMKAKSSKKEPQKSASMQQKQAKEVIKKALAEDPSVYQYDEIYDEMEETKKNAISEKKKDVPKPKYIHNIIKASERRKIENEQRMERQVQKEREQEGDEFKDKEAFVTSAYRKKIEENQKLLEEERRKDMIDEWTDVTKQQDLSGFYRNLYKTSVGNDKVESSADASTKPSENKSDTIGEKSHQDNSHSGATPELRRDHDDRSRSASPDKSDTDDRSKYKETHRRSRRAKSRSSSSGRSRSPPRRRSRERSFRQESSRRHRSRSYDRTSRKSDRKDHKSSVSGSTVLTKSEPTDETLDTKPSISVLWQKRTVGDAYEEAIERFLRRKAMSVLRPIVVTKGSEDSRHDL